MLPEADSKSMRLVAATALYFLIVFGVGFLCGPIRVFWLEPRVGEALATLCEAPFLLAAMWLAARWLPHALALRSSAFRSSAFRSSALGSTVAPLAAMGLGALILQQFADFAVGILLRGTTPAQQLAHLSTPAGLIYVALLLAFVAMPVAANWPPKQLADSYSPKAALHEIKAVHTLAWAICAGCIVALPIVAWRGQFAGAAVLATIVFVEIAILVANKWRCPLTNVAARYTDDRSDNFDIYLPLWLARNNKLIFGWLFAVALVFALALWLRQISFGA
jgi:hypothetical protein